MSEPFKILHDISLSYSPFPYSGIPLGTRLLYKILNNLGGIENSSLILGNKLEPFWRKSFSRKNRILQQTLAFSSLIEKDVYKYPILQRLRQTFSLYGVFLQRNFHLEQVDTEMFAGTLLRLFLEEGLTDVTTDTIKQQQFFLSDLSHPIVMNRVLNPIKLPLPKLNMNDFDAVIFHDANSVKLPAHTLKIIRYYDFIPLSDPDVVGYSYTNAKKHFFNLTNIIENGGVLVCINGVTAEELKARYPQMANRVFTIPYAISEMYYPDHNYSLLLDIMTLRQSSYFGKDSKPFPYELYQKKDKMDYIINVGTIEPRKNWKNLIAAFSLVRAKIKSDLKLVIAGNLGWRYDAIIQQMKPYIRSGDVIFLEGTTNAELRVLYSHAKAMVFPSYQEGFGVPPIEAMQCETPVISSDIPVHRWVHGQAAWYVNPYNPQDIADRIIEVLNEKNKGKVNELVEKGKLQAQKYSLDRNTELWAELLEELQRRGLLKHHGG